MGSEKDLAVYPVEDVAAEKIAHDDANMAMDTKTTHSRIINGARAAAEKERNMTLLQGLRLYPKAVAWSVLISTCIVMEGYDVSLVSNFCKNDPSLLCRLFDIF